MSAPPVVLSACKVLIVDDHPVMRAGLRSLIEREADFSVAAEAGTSEAAVELARQLRPHLVLIDISPPQLTGVEVTRRILNEVPEARVLVLSAHEEPELARTLFGLGVAGYSLKRSPTGELVRAVRTVVAGGIYLDPDLVATANDGEGTPSASVPNAVGVNGLSERESEVIRRIALGHTSKQMAESMGISPRTLETYKARAMSKLALRTRADLIRYALRAGWLRES